MTHVPSPSPSLVDGLIALRRDGVELLFDMSAGYPVILHWGAPLGDLSRTEVDALFSQAIPHADLDDPRDPGVLRERSRGFHGRPALSAHRAGQDWSTALTISAVEESDHQVQFTLTDPIAGIDVGLTYGIAASGLITIVVEVTNSGPDGLVIDELTSWLPLPDRAREIIDFSGRWLRERQPHRHRIEPGTLLREAREGRSGHDHTIIYSAVTEGATVATGEVWSLGLLWSGNSRHAVDAVASGRASIGAGELFEPGEVILAAGESYRAPMVVASYSDAGLDGMGDRVHRWLRSRPEHPTHRRPRPVTLNVWEAVYFDHRLDTLSALAEVAAQVGVERFVLDDGWFGARRHDRAGLGDWVVSADVWPDGLLPLADRVRALGMEFGLWFEGEMVNPDSDLYRLHPEWVLSSGGRVPPTGRHQLVLDLCNPEAFAYVLESVHQVISDVGVAYIKWDHNRTLVEPGHAGRAAAHEQTLAIYRLFDELKRRTPGLEIESCASGGGRVDLGMALHADRFWTSDSNDALERQQIQRWTSLVIPPEMLGTHIGPTISHSSGRRASIQFRAVTAFFGHAGIEWNLLEATDEELAAITRWTALYRQERGFLHSGKVVRPLSSDPSISCLGVVAHDRSRAIIGIAQVATTAGSRPDSLPVLGLDPDARYRVSVHEFDRPGTVQHQPPAWMEGTVLTGAALASAGLRLPILQPEEAILVMFDRVGS